MTADDPERRLIAYRLNPEAPPLRAAPSRRDWMDATRDRFAYRCLPMVIANMHGWEVASPTRFSAIWDGRPARDAIRLQFMDGPTELVQSHFGSGVLTFHTGYLFRTPPGVNLWVKGPTNDPKRGIAPLEGVVETDWTVAPFTMNWRFTQHDTTVFFEAGEPICTLVPVERGYVESFTPEMRELTDEPELFARYNHWRVGRRDFIVGLRVDDEPDAKQPRWQKEYFQGSLPEGGRFEHHQTRLKLREFGGGDHGDGEGEGET